MSDSNEKRSGVLVALATYNEMENLPELVEEIFRSVPDVHVLVVDDHSPDGTGDWVRETSVTEPRLHGIYRSGKLGLGTAVLAALQFAIDGKYEYVVNMDADFSHPVAAIPDMLRRMNADSPVDVVIGSRYVKGGGVQGWPLSRRLMSRAINFYARCVLRLATRDNSGSFRCYRISTLEKIDLSAFVSRGYSFFEEMLYRLKRSGASFAELPITFTDRTRGVSKINKKEAFLALVILLKIGLWGK